MLKSINLENFKVHKNTHIEVGALTILCGANGSGKSSIIQSILLMAQNGGFMQHFDIPFQLNGFLCRLGDAKDVLSLSAENDKITFEFFASTAVWECLSRIELSAFDLTKDYLKFINFTVPTIKDVSGYDGNDFYNKRLPFDRKIVEMWNIGKGFHYLSSRRDFVYERKDSSFSVDGNFQLSISEGKGELIAQFLYVFGRAIKVPTSLLHESTQEDPFLLSQVSAWQQEFSKGVNVKPVYNGDTYEIKYSFNTALGQTEEFEKRNVGYGLSYSLPVVTALLASPPGSLVIIENPDDHLHPTATHKMSELICKAAAAGIQIIIETHNDHIINGTLVNVKNGIIKPEDIRIYQFERDEETQSAKATQIKVLDGGKIDKQPPGFFEQINKDLEQIMGF